MALTYHRARWPKVTPTAVCYSPSRYVVTTTLSRYRRVVLLMLDYFHYSEQLSVRYCREQFATVDLNLLIV